MEPEAIRKRMLNNYKKGGERMTSKEIDRVIRKRMREDLEDMKRLLRVLRSGVKLEKRGRGEYKEDVKNCLWSLRSFRGSIYGLLPVNPKGRMKTYWKKANELVKEGDRLWEELKEEEKVNKTLNKILGVKKEKLSR
jgi:hypothetical protein